MSRHRTLNVLRVGDNSNSARFIKRQQTRDDGLQFHTVVGGVQGRAREFRLYGTAPEQVRPTAGSWIAEARSIGE
jgi:hypothetical protein